jgi:hypothetical protein
MPALIAPSRSVQDFVDGKISHLSEPMIKLGIPVEHDFQGMAQILLGARKHVFETNAKQIFRRNLKANRLVAQLLHPVFGD